MNSALHTRWHKLSPRDRRALCLAIAVLGGWLSWAVALQPALHTLRTVPALRSTAEQQWHTVRAGADEGQALQAQPRARAPQRSDTLQALQQATQTTLGPAARAQAQADRVVVVVKDATPQALAQWLQGVRLNARLLPQETQLRRGDRGWSGAIVLVGPGLEQP
jgi:general secretion pathway protein M